MTRHRLNIMTVFLPRENLFFLEEWVLYHLRLGGDHLYLYNNDGSRHLDFGENLEVTGRNKHGLPIYQLLAHLSATEVAARIDRVLAPYVAGGFVTQVPWQPVDARGRRVHQQAEAYLDYTARFAAAGEWTAFIDLDEFLVSDLYGTLPPLLADLDASQAAYVEMGQRAFAPRFDAAGRPVPAVLAITRCDPAVITHGGVKALVRNEALIIPTTFDSHVVHYPPVRAGTSRYVDLVGDVLRFNHYRYGAVALERSPLDHGRQVTLSADDAGLTAHLPWIAAQRRSPGGLQAGQRGRPGAWRRPAEAVVPASVAPVGAAVLDATPALAGEAELTVG